MAKTKNKSYKKNLIKKSYKNKYYKNKTNKTKPNKTKKIGGVYNTAKAITRIGKDGISTAAITLTDAGVQATTTAAGAALKSVLLTNKLIAFVTNITSETTSAIYLAISTPLSVFMFVTSQIKKLTDETSTEIQGIINEINTKGANSQLDISRINVLRKRIPILYDNITNDAIKGMISLIQSYKKITKSEIQLFNKGLNNINCKRNRITNILSPLNVRSSCIPLKVENEEEQTLINQKYDRIKFLFKTIIKYFNDKEIIMKTKIENQRAENRKNIILLKTYTYSIRNKIAQENILSSFTNICNKIIENTNNIDNLSQYNSDEVYNNYNTELTNLIIEINDKLHPVPKEKKEEQKQEIDATLSKTDPSAEQIKNEIFNPVQSVPLENNNNISEVERESSEEVP